MGGPGGAHFRRRHIELVDAIERNIRLGQKNRQLEGGLRAFDDGDGPALQIGDRRDAGTGPDGDAGIFLIALLIEDDRQRQALG